MGGGNAYLIKTWRVKRIFKKDGIMLLFTMKLNHILEYIHVLCDIDTP